MSARAKVVAAGGVAVMLVIGGLWWLNHRQPVRTEPAIEQARQASAVAAAETKSAEAHVTARIDTVTRWLARVDTVRVPDRVLHPVTHGDTAKAVATLPLVDSLYHGCREQLTVLLSDCDAFRVKALARFRADSLTLVTQQAALDQRRIPSRWSVGLCALYGVIRQPNGTLSTGAAIGACASYRIF